MANKTLGTRQKNSFRIEPSQQIVKPRNPVALAAKLRAAGSHQASNASQRLKQKRTLIKILAQPHTKDE